MCHRVFELKTSVTPPEMNCIVCRGLTVQLTAHCEPFAGGPQDLGFQDSSYCSRCRVAICPKLDLDKQTYTLQHCCHATILTLSILLYDYGRLDHNCAEECNVVLQFYHLKYGLGYQNLYLL